MTYAPNFASEKLLAGPPYLGCRVSSDWTGTDIATRGESSRRDDGRIKGKRARTADLKRGWRAFATQDPPDVGGIPDQGDTRLIHDAMFPDLPQPILVQTRDFSEVWDLIGEYAVSLAMRLTAVPADSPLRTYTSADHQRVFYTKRGDDEATGPDPMHGHSLTYTGAKDWAPRAHIARAAKAIEGGLIICELYKAGAWTAEALVRKRKNVRIALLEAEAEKREKRIVSLKVQLANCESELPECDVLVANARAAAHESAHVESIQYHEQQRTEGPT